MKRASIALKPKSRKCKNKACGDRFTPQRPLQAACSIGCAIVLSKDKLRADAEAKAKVERKSDQARKDAIKTRSDWMKEAQAAFNAFIRARDANQPCISSGRPLQAEAIGGGFDAGHYRSIGSAPHLRFDERNVHGQSKHDNRYLAGNAVDYRIGLIARIGLQAVEALEADQESRKWSTDDLRAIKALYRAKLRALQALDKGVV
jgi:phytoene dehydrogenase-like protein